MMNQVEVNFLELTDIESDAVRTSTRELLSHNEEVALTLSLPTGTVDVLVTKKEERELYEKLEGTKRSRGGTEDAGRPTMERRRHKGVDFIKGYGDLPNRELTPRTTGSRLQVSTYQKVQEQRRHRKVEGSMCAVRLPTKRGS